MPKKLNIKQVISTNPRVNAKDLQKSMEVLKSLQKTGVVRRHTYSLETRDSRGSLHYVLSESITRQ
jgi:hypothetical protein